jgi:ferredoxin/putative sterol carrier protein
MTNQNDHPTVKRYLEKKASNTVHTTIPKLSASDLRKMCLECGADDVGIVEIDRPSLAGERDDILALFPWTKSLVSFVGRINRENLRSPARSIASLELHQVEERLNHTARALASALERKGIRAATPAVGFPMETDRWLGKMHVVSHKPVAVAAGLGMMGLHRNVIHPVIGSFVLLNTVLIDAEVDEYSSPLDYNPCLECKLCAAACPTGAIGRDGVFNSINCLTHTYRELLGGFTDWVENIADSKSSVDYRGRVSDAETVSQWQSLACGPCYKSVYCMAVCPAGDEVIPQYLVDKKKFIEDVVKPLQQKTETVYVLPGSDAESHVLRTFPHKKLKRVGNGIRVPSVAAFLESMPRAFQRHNSAGLAATYHFSFSGNEQIEATVIIKDKTINVQRGHSGIPDVRVIADAKAWLRMLHKETSVLKEIIFRRIRVKGQLKLFKAFGRCFS